MTAFDTGSALDLSQDLLDDSVLDLPDRILDLLPLAVYVCDAEGRVVRFNRRAAEFWGRAPEVDDPAKRFGGSLRIYHPDGSPLPRAEWPMAEVLRTGVPVRGTELVVERPDGSRVVAETRIDAIRDRAGNIVGAINCFNDVTDRVRDNALLVGQKRVLEMVAAGAPLSDTLAELTRFIELQEDGLRCGILLVTEDGEHFMRGAGPNIPDAYYSKVDGVPITPPYRGPCGSAVHQNIQVAVPDIAADGRWTQEWRDLALSCGLASCISTPVRGSDGRPLASFAMYYGVPRDPRLARPDLIEIATHLAGIAIERARSESALRDSEERLSSELAATRRLQEISAVLIQKDDVDALYHGLIDAAAAVMCSDMATMQILHHDRRELRLIACKGFQAEAAARWERVRPSTGSTCGAALSSGQRVVVPDVETCDFMAGTRDLDAHRFAGIRAAQSTPLVSRSGSLLGMISTHWREPHLPTERDLRLLDVLARQAADLIERARSEAALRESERRTREVIEALPVAVYMTDADGRITFYNQAAVDFSGRTPELGSDEWRFAWRLHRPDGTPLPHDQYPMAVALKENRAIQGEEVVAEYPDGRSVSCLAFPTPLRDASGALTGAVNALVDITERNRAEQVAQRLASIVESSADAIISKGLDGLITTWNRGAERLFGYNREEAVGMPVTSLIPPDRQAADLALMERIRRGKRIDNFEAVRLRKDGTSVDVSLSMSPIKDANGRVVGASKIARDISERNRAEQAARRLAAIVESSGDAILSKDLDGIMATWNKGAERLFGYTAEEAVGNPVTILFPPDRMDEEESILASIRRGERVEPFETVRRCRDGTLVDISLTVSPIKDAGGRIIGASSIAQDISERKRAEAQRILLLEELNHRVKNTLATVQSVATQTLKGKASPAEEREAFEARLIALSKLHELLTAQSWEGAALRGVVLGELAPYGGGESARIAVDGPDIRLKPRAALALGMAIHELATNAAKYGALSSARGQVRVTWQIEHAAEDRLRLCWRECGGPPVKAPRRRGFGSRVIERGLAHDLGSDVELRYEPSGVVCTVDVPLAAAAAEARAVSPKFEPWGFPAGSEV